MQHGQGDHHVTAENSPCWLCWLRARELNPCIKSKSGRAIEGTD